MALVASLRLLETIWTLDLFICQMRTHLHANWCLIAAPGTKAWSYFNCHDLNLWPGDNMLKAYLIKISFFSSHSLRELYIVLIFFFLIKLHGGRSLRNQCHYEMMQCISFFPLMGLIFFLRCPDTSPKMISWAWLPWGNLDNAILGRWESEYQNKLPQVYKWVNNAPFATFTKKGKCWFYFEV